MLGLLAVLALAATAVADIDRYLDTAAYDNGAYGMYPTKAFISSKYLGPHLNVLKDDPQCDDGSYTMLSVRGHAVPDAAPMILDHRGNLIWTHNGYKQNYGLDVQEYKGKRYLTFWAGNDGVKGHGAGVYYMLDENYKEAFRIEAGNSLEGDLHEFRILPGGTVLISIYQVVQVDLTALGKGPEGYVWDGLFQEIDLETREVLFEWRSSHHYKVEETMRDIRGEGTYMSPFDYFHINSVDKDDKGNYIISSRFMHTVTCIDGKTGDIKWRLGGRNNDFKDLSGGLATNFTYQHHARWHDDYTTITLFNNGADDGTFPQEYSNGLKIRVNQETMEAEVVGNYINPELISSRSQGSMQVLPNGHVFLGFGQNAAFSEFDAEGNMLCNYHYGSSSQFMTGATQSYRALKGNWTGLPTHPPDLDLADDSAYVSWNGATEVRTWEVQRAATDKAKDEDWKSVALEEKKTFETRITLAEDEKNAFVRIAGLDKNGKILGYTRVLQANVATVDNIKVYPLYDADFIPLLILIVFCGAVALGLCAWACIAVARRWRRGYATVPKVEMGADGAEMEDGHDHWSAWGKGRTDYAAPTPRWASWTAMHNAVGTVRNPETWTRLTKWTPWNRSR